MKSHKIGEDLTSNQVFQQPAKTHPQAGPGLVEHQGRLICVNSDGLGTGYDFWVDEFIPGTEFFVYGKD